MPYVDPETPQATLLAQKAYLEAAVDQLNYLTANEGMITKLVIETTAGNIVIDSADTDQDVWPVPESGTMIGYVQGPVNQLLQGITGLIV